MGNVKMRLRMTDVEIEINGHAGRLEAVSLEASFDAATPPALAELFAMARGDQGEVERLRAERDRLKDQTAALTVEERRARADRNEVAAAIPKIAEASFAAGQAAARRVAKRKGGRK